MTAAPNEPAGPAHSSVPAGLRWHVIGHLQSNKAKYVAEFAHRFQALDRLSLARTLNNRLEARVRACFQSLHRLRDQLAQEAPSGVVLEELSMGMSGDVELADAEEIGGCNRRAAGAGVVSYGHG